MKLPDLSFLPLGLFLLAGVVLSMMTGCPPPQEAKAQSTNPTPIKQVDWELLQAPPGADNGSSRTRVPGGWIVYVEEYNTPSLVFVPDAHHKWLQPEVEAQEDKFKLYVAADQATYDAIEPVLHDSKDERVLRLLKAWKARLEAVQR